ncbi:MAG: M28 family peptidase [Myxococcales bacterium]|nr:M28 family peptidase [Myxococcales bacterium]
MSARRASSSRGRLGWGLAVLGCLACTPAAEGDDGSTGGASTGDETSEPGTTRSADDSTGALETDSTRGEGTEGGATDESTGEPACPPLPAPDPAWLAPLQQDVVARLSGAAELSPGVTLSDRATAPNRSAARQFLLAQWSALGLEGQLHAYSETGTNVFAALPATIDTDRTVVIGAHFDSVPASPGANDNATGVAMVLSLGRWLEELPCRDLDVLLVCFDEEELGLLGSAAFAEWLTTQPIEVVSVHTIDQMGWDADGDRAIELERADAGLFELYEQAEPFAPGVTPLVPTNTGFTDHVSFRELGFAAVGLTEEYVSGDTTPHYHLPSDTFDTVDLDYLASSTALLHETIGRLVTAEGS